MPRKQIWTGLALAAAAASALTGCSLSASDGTPRSFAQLSGLSAQDAVKAAARAVAARPSAKVHTVLTAPDASETADVTASFSEHPKLQGTLALGPADPTQAGAVRIPIRYADDVMYMKMGAAPTYAAQLGGRPWVRMDLEVLAKDPRTAAVGSDVLENTAPSKGFTMLTAAKDLHRIGEEQHGGVQTVHYAGTVSGADALDPNLVGRGLTADDADTVSQALAYGRISKLGYDLWLRADGLPIAETFTETTPIGTLNGEIDYSDWGTAVSVDEVPESQSVDYMDLVQKAPGGSDGSSAPSSAPSASASASEAPSAPSAPSPSSPSGTPSAPATPSSPKPTGSPSAPSTPATPATPRSTTSSSSSA